jgi:hypothetical protein
MIDVYSELKDLDYEAYVKAIQLAAAIINNLDYAKTWKDNRDFNIEREIVAYTLSMRRQK